MRRVAVTRLSLALLWILIAGLLGVVALWWWLRIVWRGVLTWAGIKTVAPLRTVALRRLVVAGRILSVKDATHHLAEAFAEFRQELDRIFILRLGLLRVGVALWRLLIARRRGRLAVGLLLRLVVALLWLRKSL